MNDSVDPALPADAAPRPLPGFLGRLDANGFATLVARLVVGGVFILHGVQKIGEPRHFHGALQNYGILPLEPPELINAIAVALPWTEVIIGVLLVLGLARRASGLISTGMLLVFTPAIVHLALKTFPDLSFGQILGKELDCGCGGGPILVWLKLAENTTLILLSVWLVVSRSRRFVIRPFL